MVSATSRRTFLRAGALSAAAVGVGSNLEAKLAFARGIVCFGSGGVPGSQQTPQVKLGVASYSFHKFDRAHVIDFTRQLNTPYLNVKDVNDQMSMKPVSETAEAVAAYQTAGIQVTALGVIYFPSSDAADIEEKFDYAKRAGVSLIVGSPTRDSLPAVEKFVQRYDIRLAIHNHGPEDKQWPSPLDILAVIKPMDPRIGLCIDVGHTARTGTDVVEAIRTSGSRVFDLHIKDLADMKVKESQVAVGDGKMPIRGIFGALNAIGYKGYVDLEYEIHEDDPLPGMIKSFAYMRGVLAGMGYPD